MWERIFGLIIVSIDSNRKEMSALIRERLDLETKFQENMEACKEEFAKALDDIRNVDMEEYNTLKIRLESDMQILEQHLATMQVCIISYHYTLF